MMTAPSDWFKFVHPLRISGVEEDGCGVFADSFFLTSGHTAQHAFTVFHEAREFLFLPEEAIFLQSDPQCPEDYDIAVFPSKGVHSPLRLGCLVSLGDSLTSLSFRHIGGPDEHHDPIECTGKVNQLMTNFFMCNMSTILREGSSGSPILNGDTVAGILVGRPGEDESVIMFTSTQSVMDAIAGRKIKER